MTYEVKPLRICRLCGNTAYTQDDLDDFRKHKTSRYGRANVCKTCSSEESSKYDSYKNWYKSKDNRLRKRYGISEDDFKQILAEQQHSCAICKTIEVGHHGTLCVDHNHETGEVRGLLCHSCNSALGLFKDNPDNLIEGFKYLITQGHYGGN